MVRQAPSALQNGQTPSPASRNSHSWHFKCPLAGGPATPEHIKGNACPSPENTLPSSEEPYSLKLVPKTTEECFRLYAFLFGFRCRWKAQPPCPRSQKQPSYSGENPRLACIGSIPCRPTAPGIPMSPAEVLPNLGVKMHWQVPSTGPWLGVNSIRKVSLKQQSGKNRTNTAILSTPRQILSGAPSYQLGASRLQADGAGPCGGSGGWVLGVHRCSGLWLRGARLHPSGGRPAPSTAGERGRGAGSPRAPGARPPPSSRSGSPPRCPAARPPG